DARRRTVGPRRMFGYERRVRRVPGVEADGRAPQWVPKNGGQSVNHTCQPSGRVEFLVYSRAQRNLVLQPRISEKQTELEPQRGGDPPILFGFVGQRIRIEE